MNPTKNPECPKCGAEIVTLAAFAKEESHYEVHFHSDGFLDYDYQQCVEGSTTYTEFRCPRCREILFTAKDTQPQEVIDFLRG